MNRIIGAVLTVGLIAAGGGVHADDAMGGHSMMKEGMQTDAMSKDGMAEDGMSGMSKDEMAARLLARAAEALSTVRSAAE